MKRKSLSLFFGNVYTPKSLLDLQREVDIFLGEVQEDGGNILDIKTCLNTDAESLITVIFEEKIK